MYTYEQLMTLSTIVIPFCFIQIVIASTIIIVKKAKSRDLKRVILLMRLFTVILITIGLDLIFHGICKIQTIPLFTLFGWQATIIGFIIIPLAIFQFYQAWAAIDVVALAEKLEIAVSEVGYYEKFCEIIPSVAGSIIGMIPSGLFLLTTVALSAGVYRLAKRNNTMVQELYCIEMLARVDILCLDKTGTITDGTMKVKDIIDIANIDPKEPKIDIIIGAMIGALEDNNLTSIALQDRFGVNFEFKKLVTLPFSSARKLSAVTFEDVGTYILGAPEFVYSGKSKKISSIVAKKSAMGYRVLMLAKSDKPIVDGKVPTNCSPVALITLEDHIRDEAYDTIAWFKENGVQVKVISGDNPVTVSEVAKRVGIEDCIPSFTTIVPLGLISSPSTAEGISGFGETPTETMTRSTGIVFVCPSTTIGHLLPDASGSPNVITCSTASHTRPLSSA